jgi:phosphoglycolate phosphatase-like HAD superfamily hydrolase
VTRALLLDLDRTLVDVQSFTDYEAACGELDEAFGDLPLADMPESGWRTATHRAMAILFSLADSPQDWTRADEIISKREMAAIDSAMAMPHLEEFLEAIRGTPRAIVTLMGQAPAEESCARFGIKIPVIVGRRAGLLPKPAPDQLETAMEILGVTADQAVMVGDSPWDAEAAIAAEVGFLGLTNGRPSVFSEATLVVENLAEATAVLG